MARVVSKSRPMSDGSTGVKFSEIAIIAMVLLVGAAMVRYYINYRHSAGYTLQEYFAGVKAGNIERQYALIDDADKQNYFPTNRDYERTAQQARGYTERISDVVITGDTSTSANITQISLKTDVFIRQYTKDQSLIQGGSSDKFSDTFFMRKDKDGNWKIVLSKSGNHGKLNMLKSTPSPPSMY